MYDHDELDPSGIVREPAPFSLRGADLRYDPIGAHVQPPRVRRVLHMAKPMPGSCLITVIENSPVLTPGRSISAAPAGAGRRVAGVLRWAAPPDENRSANRPLLALTGQVARADDTGFIAAELPDPQVSCLAVGAAGQPGQVRLPGWLPDQVSRLGNTSGDNEYAWIEDGRKIGDATTQPGTHDPEALQRGLVTLPRRCGDHPAVDRASSAAGKRK